MDWQVKTSNSTSQWFPKICLLLKLVHQAFASCTEWPMIRTVTLPALGFRGCDDNKEQAANLPSAAGVQKPRESKSLRSALLPSHTALIGQPSLLHSDVFIIVIARWVLLHYWWAHTIKKKNKAKNMHAKQTPFGLHGPVILTCSVWWLCTQAITFGCFVVFWLEK